MIKLSTSLVVASSAATTPFISHPDYPHCFTACTLMAGLEIY